MSPMEMLRGHFCSQAPARTAGEKKLSRLWQEGGTGTCRSPAAGGWHVLFQGKMTGIPDHLEPVGTHKRQQSGNVPLPFNGRCSAEWMLTVDKEVSSVALPFPHQKGRQRDLASGKDVQLDLRLFFFFFF